MKATKKSEYADSSVFTVDKACLLVTFHGHLPYHLGADDLTTKDLLPSERHESHFSRQRPMKKRVLFPSIPKKARDEYIARQAPLDVARAQVHPTLTRNLLGKRPLYHAANAPLLLT